MEGLAAESGYSLVPVTGTTEGVNVENKTTAIVEGKINEVDEFGKKAGRMCCNCYCGMHLKHTIA